MIQWFDRMGARLLANQTLDMAVDCSVEEAVERLEKDVDTGLRALLPGSGLVGRISPASVVVRIRQLLLPDLWAPVLRANLEVTPDGVRLRGRFTLMRRTISLMLFTAVVFLGLPLMAGVATAVEEGIGAGFAAVESVLAIGVVFNLLHAVGVALGRASLGELERRLRESLEEGRRDKSW